MFAGTESSSSNSMDCRTTVKQLTSIRLQKAINKNQTFDLELKKELQVLEVKRKASQKAFEKRRTQFLRNRLCVEPLKKSKSFNRGDARESRRHQMARIHVPDLRSCYSTGNLLESLLSPRHGPSCANGEESGKLFKKLSLDSANDGSGKQSLKNWGKAFSEPKNWNDDKSFPMTDHRNHYANGTSETLKVPSIGKKLSFSDDNVCKGTRLFKRQQRVKRWDASNRLTIPPIAEPLSKSDDSLSTKRRNENIPVANQKNHLPLPPLMRTRSKSFEGRRVLPGNKSTQYTRKLSWTDAAKMQRLKKNTWISRGAGQEEGHGGKEKGNANLEPKKMERSRSTPDLLDIEPEVEYLLLKDDKIRLRRMRKSLHAISLMADMKEYRYIRNVELTDQNKQETNPQSDKVSGNDLYDHAQSDRTESESLRKPESQATQDVSATDVGEGLGAIPEPDNPESEGAKVKEESEEEIFADDADKLCEEAPQDKEERFDSSTEWNLAEMFDEIRHTRYLRIRPSMSSGDPNDDDEDDGDDDSCNISYGYRVPLIIVGHTKAVFTQEEL